jgi:hypothetical protein
VDQGHYVQERPDKAAEEQARQKLSKIFGWGVHLGVSLSYAVLYGILTSIPGFPRRRAPRWIFALILAALLGWVTTLLTGPDIEITISVLAGQGWPQEVSGLNWGLGVPFWNHMLFFGICFVFIVLIPDLVRGQVQTSSMHA